MLVVELTLVVVELVSVIDPAAAYPVLLTCPEPFGPSDGRDDGPRCARRWFTPDLDRLRSDYSTAVAGISPPSSWTPATPAQTCSWACTLCDNSSASENATCKRSELL
jgi:hypothetical protein